MHTDGLAAAPDPSAKLVQLGQTEALGALDQHHRGVRHVHADLDDGRRDQHVELAVAERAHDRVLFGRAHPPVQQSQAQTRQLARTQALVLLGGRLGLQDFGFLDQRTDDERLLALLPPRGGRARRPARARRCPAAACAGTARPGGISSIAERSRSPYRLSASVRGIGVAVITSRCGTRSPSPARRRRLTRCRTPKRCCSSTITRPRRANSSLSWISAWVPTTRSTSPLGRRRVRLACAPYL